VPDLARAARAVDDFLRALGVPPESDPELAETARRVAAAWRDDLISGYWMDPKRILADATASSAPGLVVVRGISLATMCPHHLLPATGVAHVGYLPGRSVIGLGAIGKLVDCFSRRLELQEAIGRNVVTALVELAGARGAGCVIELTQTCAIVRGERRHGSSMVTTAWAGSLETDDPARAELLSAALAERRR